MIYETKVNKVYGYNGICKFRVKPLYPYTFIPLFLLFIVMWASLTSAQSIRKLVNEGVDLYKDKKFTDSEVNFKKGLEKAPENFPANFNLGDSYYKQQRYDDALSSFQSALPLAKTNDERAKAYHNIGNSLLKSQKYKESIESYKKSLKLNPNDQDTKYNLSYALEMLKQQQNQQQQNKDNKDNKDKNNQNKQDQNKDQNKDNKDKNKQDKDKNQQNQNQDQQKPKDQESQQDQLKQKDQKISKQEAERILQALKNNEKDLQKKLRKQKGVPVKIDKDW